MKLSVYLQNDAVKKQINQVVGGKNGTRFISSIVSAVQSTPALQECTSPSIVNAALLGEALNLSPSPQLGQFYMVPFDNKKKGCKEAQFQLGYKGYIQLAIRSGYYKKLNVLAIKEGELVRYDPLDEEVEVNLIEDDILREEAPTMGYFAMFEYENGFRKTLYWSKKKMLAHAEKYSFAFYKNGGAKSLELLEQGKIPEKDMWKYSSFWFKDFDGMALKTMLRQLISKWGIMSIDLQNAIDKDMAVIHEDGKTDYVDAVKAEDDGVVSDQELQEVQEDQPAAPGTQQPDPNGIEASFFGYIQDPNTDAGTARKITVTIAFKPNQERNFIATGVQTKTTLAPALGAVTALSMGKDLRTGEVEAVEIGNQIPGQMSVQDVPGVVPEAGTTVVDGKVIDKATGEVVADSVPEQAGKVIDLRTAKQA